MALRYNPPPGWEVPPDGWTPPPNWQPDPSWPAAPEGWIFWLDPEQRGKHRPRARFSRKVVAAAAIVALLAIGGTTYSLHSRGPQGVALPMIPPVPTLGSDLAGPTDGPRPTASKINGTATTAGPTTGPTTTATVSPPTAGQPTTAPVGAPTPTKAPPATATAGPTVSPTPDCAELHPIGKYFGLCPTPTR